MGSSSHQRVASNTQWKLEPKDLPSLRLLGKGLSGFLYETTWKGNQYTRKDFPLGSVEHKISVFQKEAQSLFSLDHPNIVRCFGFTVGKSSCSLLQEYVHDNLQTAIQRRIEEQRKKKTISDSSTGTSSSGSPSPFEMPQAVDIISKLAAGMKYLHDKEIAHGDLKPKNVLVSLESDAIKDVKVADFGLVETKKRIKLISKRRRHLDTLMWKAPERLEKLLGPITADSNDFFTDSDTDSGEETDNSGDFMRSTLAMADVYSFGLTCAYIIGGKLLYPSMSFNLLQERKLQGLQPELPSTCPNYLKFIICWSLDTKPSNRPTFRAIVTIQAFLPLLPRLMNFMKGAQSLYFLILFCNTKLMLLK